MSSLLAKIDINEMIYTFMMMSLAGLILMWFFFTTFPDHDANLLYLILAIVFTVLAPGFFAYLWYREKKT